MPLPKPYDDGDEDDDDDDHDDDDITKYVIIWLVVLTTNKCCLRSFGLCFILINQWTLTFDERMMISGC